MLQLRVAELIHYAVHYTAVHVYVPPKAVPFHTRPVTNWNGRVEISFPAAATPMMMDSPHPL